MGVSILVIALIISFVLWMQPFEGQLYACVYIDGEFIEGEPLQTTLNQIDIKTQYGTNVLVILNNRAYVKDTDCGYAQCVNKGYISRPTESIVCAPHGLVITIEDERSLKDK